MVNEAIAILEPIATQKSLRLVNHITPASDIPPVLADINRLQQILFNLLGNGLKFTPAGSVSIDASYASDASDAIDVSDASDGDSFPTDAPVPETPQLCIRVTDTGIGIPEDQQDRIFEAFEQVDGSASREYGGAGLGLAIVRRLVTAHGGRVEVRSRVNVGTTFTVWLPAAVGADPISLADVAGLRESRPFVTVADTDEIAQLEPAIARADPNPMPLPASALNAPSLSTTVTNNLEAIRKFAPSDGRSQFQILVVDDDVQVLELLRPLLEPWGLQLTTLADPAQLWDSLEQVQPNLLVLDVEMPGANGLELCQALRTDEQWRQLPILLLTVHEDAQTLQQAFHVGADDFVCKSTMATELPQRILKRLQ